MTHLSQWPTIAEAAAALQTSSRSIERRIAAGEIEARHRPRPGRKPETVCNPADIERLKPQPFVMPETAANGALTKAEKIPAAGALDLIAAAIAGAHHTGPPARTWLTAAEAAEASGLSIRLLKRLASAGQIAAVRDKRQWKFHREKLAAWTPGTK